MLNLDHEALRALDRSHADDLTRLHRPGPFVVLLAAAWRTAHRMAGALQAHLGAAAAARRGAAGAGAPPLAGPGPCWPSLRSPARIQPHDCR
jgi:hypothetical protein